MITAAHGILLVEIIVGLVLLEAVALWIWFGRRGQAGLRSGAMASLAAGAALMLALRSALSGQNFLWVAFFLSVSGLAHLVDVRARWQESSR